MLQRLLVRMDIWVRRAERACWVVLCGVVLIAPWLGIEPPLAGNVGQGAVALDVMVTAMMAMAALAQTVRIVQASPTEHIVMRIASWLLLLTLCLLAGRMLWILVTVGDIRMTTTMAIALLCLAASVVLHACGWVVYGTGDR